MEGIILEKLKKRINWLKKKRPGYKDILDFYRKVREGQEEIKHSLKTEPILLKKEWKGLLFKEGFPLLEKKDFPLDIETASTLFQLLCRIGKEANPYMREQVKKIEVEFGRKKIELKTLLKGGFNERKIEQTADKIGLDRKVFSFFSQESIRPSIEAGVEKISNELDTETWMKDFCPICGSLPSLSLLKEEVGKRYLLCSFCGYQWRNSKLICTFCGNKDQDSLRYFYGEGEEIYRIDTCEKCHQYIKTIDQRNIEFIDLVLEDLATLHLDLLASQKGYKRPVPNPWTT